MTTSEPAAPPRPILLVDDDAPLTTGYEMVLRRHGFNNLLCFSDSREALAAVREQSLVLAIVDLSMPFVSGEELLAELVERQPHTPVIIVTGRDAVVSAVT